MPCFANSDIYSTIKELRDRFHDKMSDVEYVKIVDDLIYRSNDNWRTNQYDNFQKLTNGIRP